MTSLVSTAVVRADTSTPGSVDRQHLRRWWILGVLGLAQLMVVLDTTVVNIALPSAQRDLGFSTADRQWVVTAYALAFGSLLLLGGRLADMVGRKRMFLIGLVGFAAASAVGGAAVNFDMFSLRRLCRY
jgi:MFS family permease